MKKNKLQLPKWGTEHENGNWHRGTANILSYQIIYCMFHWKKKYMIILHNILCSMKKKENYLQLQMGGTERENGDRHRGIRPIDQRI